MSGQWACPDARLVLRADAPRDEWLAARRTGLGGSDAATLMGVNRWSNRYQLWADKTGPGSDDQGTDATRRGVWLEGHLADWFAGETGIPVRRAGLMRSRRHEWMLGSLDRLTGDGGIWEAKTTGVWTGDADTWTAGEPTAAAYHQAQWYLAVTGRSHAWFTAFVDPSPILIGPVARDEDLIAAMVDEGETFWVRHVLGGTQPPVDPATVTDAELDSRWPAVEPDAVTDITTSAADALALTVDQLADVQADLAQRSAEARRLEKIRDSLRTRLRAAAEGREWLALHGRPVARWATTTKNGQPLAGRIDTKALTAAMPEVAEQFMRPAAPRFQLIGETA